MSFKLHISSIRRLWHCLAENGAGSKSPGHWQQIQEFMLLDEPFAGIDPIAINDIRQLVRQLTSRGLGVLITDHNVRETLEIIDRALIIHEGHVLMEGTPREIVANPDVRRLYLGEGFSL